jgi:hypothetical protein
MNVAAVCRREANRRQSRGGSDRFEKTRHLALLDLPLSLGKTRSESVQSLIGSESSRLDVLDNALRSTIRIHVALDG